MKKTADRVLAAERFVAAIWFYVWRHPDWMAAWADGKSAMNNHTDPYWEMVSSQTPEDFESLSRAVARRKCKEKVGFSSFDEVAEEYRPDPSCPSCGLGPCWKDGKANGRQRYRCGSCKSRFTALTGTIFEHSKKDLPTWVEFITLMCYNVPLDAAAEVCGISHQTAFEWRHRAFATVDGYQEERKLKDRVWIDEMYVTDASLTGDPKWRPRRGLSKDKICITVAIDVYKNPVAVLSGHGKPSSKRTKDALLERIEPGATIVHDMEKSHRALVKALGGIDEAYKADTKDPAYLIGMEMANNLCSWIRRYLWRFPGMKPENLQSYLNWFVYLFRVRRDNEKWPKVERVVRHLTMVNASFRSS